MDEAAFSPDGRRVFTSSRGGSADLWDLATGEAVRTYDSLQGSLSEKRIKLTDLYDMVAKMDVTKLPKKTPLCGKAILSPDGRRILLPTNKGVRIVDVERSEVQVDFGDALDPESPVAFIPGGRCLLAAAKGGRSSGRCRPGKLLGQMIPWDGGGGVVVALDGRFDSSELSTIQGIQWVVPDNPLLPLVPRDLHARLLRAPVARPPAGGRCLPRGASSGSAEPGAAEGGTPRGRAGGRTERRAGNPNARWCFCHGSERRYRRRHDHRGVRRPAIPPHGHFVGRWPQPASVEPAAEPDPTSEEQMAAWRAPTASRSDPTARQPAPSPSTCRHREKPGPVEFTAYAFNEDRVKSAPARVTYDAPARPLSGKPRAYLICMGVGASQSTTWDLAFAPADTQYVANALGEALTKAGRYEVVPVLLTSERADNGSVAGAAAPKANLQATLDLLAEQQVDAGDPEANRRRGPAAGGDAGRPGGAVVLGPRLHQRQRRPVPPALRRRRGQAPGRGDPRQVHKHRRAVVVAAPGGRRGTGDGRRRLPLGGRRAAAGVQARALGRPRTWAS